MHAMEDQSRRAKRPEVAASALLLCALGSAGCVKFANELDTVAAEEAVASLSGGVAPAGRDWSCTAAGGVEAAAEGSQAPLTFALSIEDFVTGQPLSGVQVRACFRADVECESPVGGAVLSDAEGLARVTTFQGFNGYLELTSEGRLPSMSFFAAPWSPALLAELEGVPLRLLPAASLLALSSATNVPLDPTSGVVAVTALDCSGSSAGGVRLELDRSAIPYAFIDDLPVINQDSTGSQGLAGFVNVPPGIVVVSGYREGASEPMGVESLLVRSSWVSTSFLLPAFSR